MDPSLDRLSRIKNYVIVSTANILSQRIGGAKTMATNGKDVLNSLIDYETIVKTTKRYSGRVICLPGITTAVPGWEK